MRMHYTTAATQAEDQQPVADLNRSGQASGAMDKNL
jgi:hypothetical protein